MDQKDRMITMVPICGIVAFLGVFLFAAGYDRWIWLPVIGLGTLGAVVFGVLFWKWKQLIMPVSRCFLELEGTCFSIVQPLKDGTYESGRIYMEEVECLIQGKQSGDFYFQVRQGGRSKIKDSSGKECTVLHIRPFGYSREIIDELYERIKEKTIGIAKIYEHEK